VPSTGNRPEPDKCPQNSSILILVQHSLQMDVNVISLKVKGHADSSIVCRLPIGVNGFEHLQRVMSALRNERGVYKVYR
jgi:(p)ppGpp synthase/HD superfamily hydrolase